MVYPVVLSLGIGALAARSSPLAPRADQDHTLDSISPTANLTWLPCYEQFQCARLLAPLDPDDSSISDTVSIPLVKLPAPLNGTNDTYQGMVLINPGGPGQSGTGFLLESWPLLLEGVGPQWDIVGFDPRGVAYSSPSANCSGPKFTEEARMKKRADGIWSPQEPLGYLTDSLHVDQQIGQTCQQRIGNETGIGRYMSTYYVVRDMLAIVDAFNRSTDGARAVEPDLVHYWGFSYGTYIGMELATEFPDRVGHLVLDGTVDPYDYRTAKWLKVGTLADEVIQQFLYFCRLAGPTSCAFAIDSTTLLGPRLERILNALDPGMAASHGWANVSQIESSLYFLTNFMVGWALEPLTGFPTMGTVLAAIEPVVLNPQNFSVNTLLAVIQENTPSNPTYPGQMAQRSEWTPAVLCTDAESIPTPSNETITSLLDIKSNQSSITANLVVMDSFLGCAGWTIRPKHRFTGKFGGQSNRPIQWVANTFDPTCPSPNAYENQKRFNGSEIILIDGLGHTSLSTRNQCGNAAIRDYLASGSPVAKFCPLEAVPFNVTGVTELKWVGKGEQPDFITCPKCK